MEEVFNSITHGIGVFLSIAALVLLIVKAVQSGDNWHIVSSVIYGSTLVLLYLASTLFHSFMFTSARNIFNILDHSAIYLLIAGTYTPFVLVSLRGPIGWTLFGIIWGLTAIGIVYKLFFLEKWRTLSTIIYIIMGWLIIFAIKPLLNSVPVGGLYWILAGGIFYTVGVIFYVWKKLYFSHVIWHLFVLAGSICHFFAILWYIIP
ncbi:MAG: hemolysin III family protein [Chlorobi bacterium]|nr:hemolysin III family protein [Chlorobiota bacterium]